MFICASILAAVIAVVGSVFVVITDATDYYFSSMDFCATSCHVMDINVYKELKESKHWTTSTGVRANCADCHVSRRLSFAMIDHFLGTKELFVQLTHRDLDKPGEFEKLRPAAADRIRFAMIKNDSASCRGCHDMEAIKPERIRGQNQHDDALEKGTTCIICHYNLVHKEVEPSPAFNKAIEMAIGQGLDDEESEFEDEDEVL
jgi:nitrate/TMAO reductase-like tetraheme cytochrome c subunit